MECLDFLQFQDALKKMRDLDDKLVYALNTQVLTPSFQSKADPTANCKSLYDQLVKNNERREAAIQGCIKVSSDRVKELKAESENSSAAAKLLSKEQTKLRLLKSELNVEEVVKDRSMKLYYERCREYFKPANFIL